MEGLRNILISLVAILSFSFGDFQQEMVANWNRDTLENARVFYSREDAKVYELAEAYYYYTLEEEEVIMNIETFYEAFAILAVSFQKQLEVFCLDPNAKYNKAYGIIDKNNLCKVVYKSYGLKDSTALNTDTKNMSVSIYGWLEYFHHFDIWNQIEYKEVKSYIDYLKHVAPADKLRGSEGLKRFNKMGEQ